MREVGMEQVMKMPGIAKEQAYHSIHKTGKTEPPPVFPWQQWALSHLEADSAENILHLGCGRGALTRKIASTISVHTELVGVDNSFELLHQAEALTRNRTERRIQWLMGNWDHIFYPDQSFDRIITDFVLTTTTQWPVVLSELSRLTRPGGRIILLTHGPRDTFLARIAHRIWYWSETYRRFTGLPTRPCCVSHPTIAEIVQVLSPQFALLTSQQWLGGFVEGLLLENVGPSNPFLL
ncbi:hypothetical protein CO251_08315 [Sulfobacillus sp. hq2]|nr:hypothetical protein CO251_08315 [Sulfobacillus sp. hq2]